MFAYKLNPYLWDDLIWKLYLTKFLLEPKKLPKGFLAKKMVPPASRTFQKHSAREHLMVFCKNSKNCFSQEKWFLTAEKD